MDNGVLSINATETVVQIPFKFYLFKTVVSGICFINIDDEFTIEWDDSDVLKDIDSEELIKLERVIGFDCFSTFRIISPIEDLTPLLENNYIH